MRLIEAFVLDGCVTLVAVFVLATELLLVAVFRRGSSLAMLLANALSGLSLIMALRAALLGPDPAMVALWLGAGFIAHLADLAQRLRRQGSNPALRTLPERLPRDERATGPRPPPAGRPPPR
ncbi:MAG: hypothetical protein INR68_17085 [Methylobacterium mesophilicum]|nr:hypothetical protein [Methylobacterium mesophilicum]